MEEGKDVCDDDETRKGEGTGDAEGTEKCLAGDTIDETDALAAAPATSVAVPAGDVVELDGRHRAVVQSILDVRNSSEILSGRRSSNMCVGWHSSRVTCDVCPTYA